MRNQDTLIKQSPWCIHQNTLIEESLRRQLSYNQITLLEVQPESSHPVYSSARVMHTVQLEPVTVQLHLIYTFNTTNKQFSKNIVTHSIGEATQIDVI